MKLSESRWVVTAAWWNTEMRKGAWRVNNFNLPMSFLSEVSTTQCPEEIPWTHEFFLRVKRENKVRIWHFHPFRMLTQRISFFCLSQNIEGIISQQLRTNMTSQVSMAGPCTPVMHLTCCFNQNLLAGLTGEGLSLPKLICKDQKS